MKTKYIQLRPTGPRIFVNQVPPREGGPVLQLTPEMELQNAGKPPHEWQLDWPVDLLALLPPPAKKRAKIDIMNMWSRLWPHLITAALSASTALALKELI